MNADRQSEARSSIREEPIQAAHAPTPGRLKKLSLVHMSAPNSEQSHAWSLTEAEHLLSGDVTTLLADQATLVLSTRHLLSGKQETGSKLPLKIKKADIWQFARFCVVGSLNAIIDFLVLNMLFWTHPPTDMWLVLSYNSAAVLLAATN